VRKHIEVSGGYFLFFEKNYMQAKDVNQCYLVTVLRENRNWSHNMLWYDSFPFTSPFFCILFVWWSWS